MGYSVVVGRVIEATAEWLKRAERFETASNRMFVPYRERRYVEALTVAREAQAQFPERDSRTTRWIACLECLAGETEAALRTLQDGRARGLWWAPSALIEEADLLALHEDPQLVALAAECAELQRAARETARPEVVVIPPAEQSRAGVGAAPRGGVNGPPVLIALHFRWGTARDFVVHWRAAAEAGWLVAVPQGSQIVGPDAFEWADDDQTAADLQWVWQRLSEDYELDGSRVVLAGASGGGRAALEHGLGGTPIPVHGVMPIVPSIADPMRFEPKIAASVERGVRAWLFTGEHDGRRAKTEALYAAMEAHGMATRLTVVPGMGHAVPPDLAARLPEALRFLLGDS